MPLSDGISLETVKIDEMGKGRDLPIPCPMDNIFCKDRGHALGLYLAQPSVPGGFCSNRSCSTAGVAYSMACPSGQQHGSPSRLPPKFLPEELSTISSYRCTAPVLQRRKLKHALTSFRDRDPYSDQGLNV